MSLRLSFLRLTLHIFIKAGVRGVLEGPSAFEAIT